MFFSISFSNFLCCPLMHCYNVSLFLKLTLSSRLRFEKVCCREVVYSHVAWSSSNPCHWTNFWWICYWASIITVSCKIFLGWIIGDTATFVKGSGMYPWVWSGLPWHVTMVALNVMWCFFYLYIFKFYFWNIS